MMAAPVRAMELHTPEALARKAAASAEQAAAYVHLDGPERRRLTDRLDRIAAAVAALVETRGDGWREASAAWSEAVATWWTLGQTERRVAHRESKRRAALGLLPYDDLYQEGLVGLYEAARRFDPARGVPFNHHAGWWVRAAINRAIETSGRPVRVSSQSCQDATNARRLMSRAESGGAPLTLLQIAGALGIEHDRLEAALAATSPSASLDAPLNEDSHFGDAVLVAERWDPDSELDQAARARAFHQHVAQLDDRLRSVVASRLEGQTLAQIAVALGVSRERARQLLQTATTLLMTSLVGGAS